MKSMKNDKMDDHVKAKFDNFAPPVPPDLWNKIESQLDAKESIQTKPIKSTRLSFFLYSGAIAASLLIAFAFWNLGENEVIHLRGNSELYTSKGPVENESEQGSKKDDKKIQQGSVLTIDQVAAVKKPVKIAETVIPNPQIMDVKLVAEASLENSVKAVDYNAMNVESTFSLPVSEVSIAMVEILPLEGEVIALEESIPLQEGFRDRLREEISTSKSKRIGVSTVLNFLAKGLTNENGNSIEFSESEEGILKLDLKLGFAKSND